MSNDSNFVQAAIPRFDDHYNHWSMLMENLLRAKEYWAIVESGIQWPPAGAAPISEAHKAELEVKKLKDLKAKNYLFQAIDRPILETILCKDTSKDIWESMKTKYQGSSRVGRAQLQALRRDFEVLQIKDGESVTCYFGRTMEITNKMKCHGETITNVVVVEKILRFMTQDFNYVVCSIEESKIIDNLSLDELQSSLLVHEQKMDRSSSTEEQALKACTNSHSNSLRRKGRGRGRGRGDRKVNDGSRNFKGNNNHSEGKDKNWDHNKSKIECYRCHRYGHYANECYTKESNINRRKENSNFVEDNHEAETSLKKESRPSQTFGTWTQDVAIT